MKAWPFAILVVYPLSLFSGVFASKIADPWGQCGGAGVTESACPEGFFCITLNERYSHCVKDGFAQLPEDRLRLLRRRGNTSMPVTGPTQGGVVMRLPIQQLHSKQPDEFNMFVLGLFMMQRVPETDPLSYYQIAGIHGLPFIPWGEPSNPDIQDTNNGYCTHASALFTTWHRPYLSLIEQRIATHAINEASKFRGPDAQRWQNAARRVRLPYWDWAVDSSIPNILRQQQISIFRPAPSNGQPQRITIANPLYQYVFTDNTLKEQYFTEQYISAPWTLRKPIEGNRRASQNDLASRDMVMGFPVRRQNTFHLFSIANFTMFTTNKYVPGEDPIAWTSIEQIHNGVHVSTGGYLGHMSTIDYSAFDPIFWLHHANVDRLTTMYQAAHPGQVVTPLPASEVFARRVQNGDMDTIDTPLWPFRKTDGQFFTSRDVSTAGSIWGLGYSYPEVPVEYCGRSDDELKAFTIGRINALYSPSLGRSELKARSDGSLTRREWICHYVFIPAQVCGTAQLNILLAGSKGNNPNVVEEDHLVGFGSAMAKMKYSDRQKEMKMTAAIPLTAALEDRGVDISDVEAVVRYLRTNLKWVMMKDSKMYDLSKVPSLKVGVSSSVVTYSGDSCELPMWGRFETHYEITERKICGMTEDDSAMVGSDDALKYLAVDDSLY